MNFALLEPPESPLPPLPLRQLTDPRDGFYNLFMNEPLFPSGPWTGFYNYAPGDRHRMDLDLVFSHGALSGDGVDDIGRFCVKGRYDAAHSECYWTKTYVGGHDVFYRGFREGKGIWGTWEITVLDHGGFHIWPRRAGAGEEDAASEEVAEPVEAVGREIRIAPGN